MGDVVIRLLFAATERHISGWMGWVVYNMGYKNGSVIIFNKKNAIQWLHLYVLLTFLFWNGKLTIKILTDGINADIVKPTNADFEIKWSYNI